MTLSPRLRIERLILFSRAGLATISWLVAGIDPFEPAATASLTQRTLEIYLLYSWCLIPFLWFQPLKVKAIGLASHIIDVLAVTLLVTLTHGSTSPFFTYFVFALFASALRWQKPGIIWSALAFLCLYSGSSIFLELTNSLDSEELEVNRFIMRNVHIMIVAVLLTYLTTIEERIRLELGRLREWPLYKPATTPPESFFRETLAYAANVLETPRVMLFWEEAEEPTNYFAMFGPEEFQLQSQPPIVNHAPISADFRDSHFLCNDLTRQPPKTVCVSGQDIMSRTGNSLHPDLIARYQIQTVIGLKLTGQVFQGYLLLLDKPAPTSDDLNLGILAAQQVATRIDQFILHTQQHKTAAIEERIKMARDLHDGVLQTLTGIALQVKNITRSLDLNTSTARQDLEQLQALIQNEQRYLRQFIQQLKPTAAIASNIPLNLNQRLQELAEIVLQQWQLKTAIKRLPNQASITDPMVKDVYHLVREALINCARHAHASHVQVEFQLDQDNLCINITDNGQGFPFHGKFELTDPILIHLGPQTIIERIRSLRGNLCVNSKSTGTNLEIRLPIIVPETSERRADTLNDKPQEQTQCPSN